MSRARAEEPDWKKIHTFINIFGANLPLHRNFQLAFFANGRFKNFGAQSLQMDDYRVRKMVKQAKK